MSWLFKYRCRYTIAIQYNRNCYTALLFQFWGADVMLLVQTLPPLTSQNICCAKVYISASQFPENSTELCSHFGIMATIGIAGHATHRKKNSCKTMNVFFSDSQTHSHYSLQYNLKSPEESHQCHTVMPFVWTGRQPAQPDSGAALWVLRNISPMRYERRQTCDNPS